MTRMHSSRMRTARCSTCLSCHTQPPTMHALLPHMLPAMHAPTLPCMRPAMYATLAMYAPPFILHAPTPLPYTPPCHAPPLWTETPVKALPSQTSFAGGNKIWRWYCKTETLKCSPVRFQEKQLWCKCIQCIFHLFILIFLLFLVQD